MAPKKTPKVSGDFTIEAWVALGAYPKHWCPIVDHQRPLEEGSFYGYFFGIDARGKLIFRVCVDKTWKEIQSKVRIPLDKWTYVVGVYVPNKGLVVYVNGKIEGILKTQGKFTPAGWLSLLIGKSRVKRKPDGTLRPNATEAVYTFLDGILDNVKIYDRALSAKEISASFAKNKTMEKPELPTRVLPVGPKERQNKFGAINTTLKYYDAWDALWRVSNNADVVVCFDESPVRFIFWRGTSYIPHWVTENGIWYDNEFNETWSAKGCHEPMSNKQCRYARVRVIENNSARVVVRWRYALVDNWYNFALIDSLTGWGDWVDETYTIYPDMIVVRKNVLMSKLPTAPHQWQESIIVMGPGQRPDKVLNLAALTLANMAGETHTYSWEKKTPPRLPKQPQGANIQIINTRSQYHPFSAFMPQGKPWVDVYAGEIRREVCIFPWWNHWPVAQRPCDGRYAMFADRASHCSLTHWHWKPYQSTAHSLTKIMLTGLTDKGADYLVKLTKSWSYPADIRIKGNNFTNARYDQSQRAYLLDFKKQGSVLNLQLVADENSPVVNPAFVIKNWGHQCALLKLNGRTITRGKKFRVGHSSTFEGTDLIIWIETESTTPIKITLTPVK